jgi:CrcB protein
MPQLTTIGLLALAGAAGTLCRFGLAGLVNTVLGKSFPWGTLAVNAVGCLLFGLIAPHVETRLTLSPQTRLILLTGFLGAFTTFSTFAFETTELIQKQAWLAVGANMLAQNVLGILCVLAGMALARAGT